MRTENPLAILERIRAPGALRPPVAERCEFCASEIAADHEHVVDVEQRTLKCACRPCSILFSGGGAAGGRLRTVPDRHLAIDGFRLGSGDWEDMQIPVRIAFFFRSSATGAVTAFYPSPAGATESLLDVGAWDRVVASNPALTGVEDDVEAVLVRLTDEGPDAFVVPIDVCYELVGHLRRRWKGFDGGREARTYAESFFDGLRSRSPSPRLAR